MRTTWRILIVLLPLLAVCVHSAPQWPGRAMMWQGQGSDQLIELAQAWENGVCRASVGNWCAKQSSIAGTTGHETQYVDAHIASTAGHETEKEPTQEVVHAHLVEIPKPEKLGDHDLYFPIPYWDGEPQEEADTEQIYSDVVPLEETVVEQQEPQRIEETSPVIEGGKILMVGDSLMNDVVSGMRTVLGPEFKIINKARASTGLSNREYYNWPAVAAQEASLAQPDWVVIHLGGNDGQDIMENGKRAVFGSQAWEERYLARTEEMIEAIYQASPRAKIIWLGLPAMRAGRYADKSLKIAQLQEQAARKAGVMFVPGSALGQQYQKSGPGTDNRVVVLRSDDGIHYTRAGGSVLGMSICKSAGWKTKL